MSVQNLLRNLVTEAQLNQQQSLRSQKMKELAAAAPRSQAARLSAPSPIVRPADNSMAQGMSSLGKALGDIGDMRKESAAKDAISALYAPPPMSEADLMEGVEPSAPQVNSTMLQRVLMQHPGTNAAKQGMSMVNMLAGQEQNKFMNEFRQKQLDQTEAQNLRQIAATKELKRMQLEVDSKKRFKPAGPLDYREQGVNPDDYRLSQNQYGEAKIDYMPTYERRVALKSAGRPPVPPRPFEDQFAKDQGASASKYIDKVQQTGEKARGILATNRRVDGLLKNLETGTFTGAKLSISKIGKAFGISDEFLNKMGFMDLDEIADGETFSNIAAGFVFDALENFTGAISEGEREYVESVVPSLQTSPAGIRKIMAIRNAIARRAILKEKMLAEWSQKRDKEGKSPSPNSRNADNETFNQSYNNFIDTEKGGLFTKEEKASFKALGNLESDKINFETREIKGKTYRKISGTWYSIGSN